MRCEADSSEPSACRTALRERMQATQRCALQRAVCAPRTGTKADTQRLANAMVHCVRHGIRRSSLPAVTPRALSWWLWVAQAMHVRSLSWRAFKSSCCSPPVAEVLTVPRKPLLLQARVLLFLRQRCIVRLLPLPISIFPAAGCVPSPALMRPKPAALAGRAS